MRGKVDFHVHSNASDGSLSPREVVRKAGEEGLDVIAITDHDTTSGISDAVEAAEEFGVMVIPGVEISIDFQPGTNHLCGYFIDIENDELKDNLQFVQNARSNRNPMIVQKLNALGIDITMSEIVEQAGGDQIGRPHFAKVLVRKGYVKDTKEAFTKYLAKGAPCYMDKQRLSIEHAVKMIRNAGGVAVLAHPAELGFDTEEKYREYFRYAKDTGVGGIESYSSHHSKDQNAVFRRLADELQMFSTGGSDFHGETKPKIQLGVFGENVDIDTNELIETMKSLVIE
jgi:predicted metal-dependent phosphoesterase TrpH